MKKTRKSSYLVVVLVVLLLALAVGYAAFSTSLNITGTATAKGEWNIHFDNLSISTADTNNSAVLSKNKVDNDKLTVNVSLTQPGDSKTVTVDIVNEGSVDATLNKLTITAKDGTSTDISADGETYTSGAIKMTVTKLSDGTDLVAKTGSLTYTITFEWPTDYTTASVNDTMSFDITFDYSQKV